jgi:hypothetical protein
VFGIRSEKLDTNRTFYFIKIEIFARPFVPSKNPFRRNKFGRENISAIFLAELAKNFVGHSRHGREIKRKAGKPWKRRRRSNGVMECWSHAKNDECRMTNDEGMIKEAASATMLWRGKRMRI